MKLLILFLLALVPGLLHAQSSFYDLSVVSFSGKVVNMSSYKGKKVLIIVASPAALRAKTASRYLGKIQSTFPKLSVLVLPAGDIAKDSSAFGYEPSQEPQLSSTIFSTLAIAGKNKEAQQHPLIRWLTRSDNNRHFDLDITSDEQFFVISESGVLYAALGKGVPNEVLKTVLEAEDVKPQQVVTEINRQ